MSLYADKIHIHCDHENCDNNVIIDDEELGSNDLSGLGGIHHFSIADVISDYAFNRGWVVDKNKEDKVSCPSCDDGN